MPGSKLESLGSLQRFFAALAGKAAETPQLDGSRALFEQKVARVHEMAQQQAELTASKQDVSKQLRKEMVEDEKPGGSAQGSSAMRRIRNCFKNTFWWNKDARMPLQDVNAALAGRGDPLRVQDLEKSLVLKALGLDDGKVVLEALGLAV